MDDTYESRNRTQEKGNLYAKDKIIFEQTTDERQKDVDKLLDMIGFMKIVEWAENLNMLDGIAKLQLVELG